MGDFFGRLGNALVGVADYAEPFMLQAEAAKIQDARDTRLEQWSTAREQRGYAHAENLESGRQKHVEGLQESRQKFEGEQNDKRNALTKDEIKIRLAQFGLESEKLTMQQAEHALQVQNLQQQIDTNAIALEDAQEMRDLTKQYVDALGKGEAATADKLYTQIEGRLKAAGKLEDVFRLGEVGSELSPQGKSGVILNARTGDVRIVKPGDVQGTPGGRTIPEAAAAKLRANPSPQMRAHFDATFGSGAANSILGPAK